MRSESGQRSQQTQAEGRALAPAVEPASTGACVLGFVPLQWIDRGIFRGNMILCTSGGSLCVGAYRMLAAGIQGDLDSVCRTFWNLKNLNRVASKYQTLVRYLVQP